MLKRIIKAKHRHKYKHKAQAQAQSTSTSTSINDKHKKCKRTSTSFTISYGQPTLLFCAMTNCFHFQVCLHYGEGVKEELPWSCPVDRSTKTVGLMPTGDAPWMPKPGYE